MEPRLSSPVDLRFKADWGQANLTRISGWLAQEIGDRSPMGSTFSIHAGRAGIDAIEALRDGKVDIALVTPAASAACCTTAAGLRGIRPLRGSGRSARSPTATAWWSPSTRPSTSENVADLSAIADRLVIATSADDGVNAIGLAAHYGLKLAGADPEQLRPRRRPIPSTTSAPFPSCTRSRPARRT